MGNLINFLVYLFYNEFSDLFSLINKRWVSSPIVRKYQRFLKLNKHFDSHRFPANKRKSFKFSVSLNVLSFFFCFSSFLFSRLQVVTHKHKTEKFRFSSLLLGFSSFFWKLENNTRPNFDEADDVNRNFTQLKCAKGKLEHKTSDIRKMFFFLLSVEDAGKWKTIMFKCVKFSFIYKTIEAKNS